MDTATRGAPTSRPETDDSASAISGRGRLDVEPRRSAGSKMQCHASSMFREWFSSTEHSYVSIACAYIRCRHRRYWTRDRPAAIMTLSSLVAAASSIRQHIVPKNHHQRQASFLSNSSMLESTSARAFKARVDNAKRFAMSLSVMTKSA